MLEQLDLFQKDALEPLVPGIKPTWAGRRLQQPAGILEPQESQAKEPEPLFETAANPGEGTADAAPAEDRQKSNRGRKSIREQSLDAALVQVPDDSSLFSKQYYGIGEVATMFHVNPSLLRYWESEFGILKLRKNGKGDRFFRPEDIKTLQQIHYLLREKKFTIEGAREFLKQGKKAGAKLQAVESLKQIRLFLLEMKAMLSAKEG